MKSDLDDGDSTNWFYQQIVLRNHRNTKSLNTEKKNRGIRQFIKIKVGSYQNGWQTFMDFVLTHFRCPGVYSTIRRLKIENTWLFPLCQNQTLFLMAFLTNLTSWVVVSAPPQGFQFTFRRGGGMVPPLGAGLSQVGGECRVKHHDNRIE